ncbi:MAG TPA: DUF1993 domain-containing protein [Polyangiaceae bacterium]|nr:DUF1993 domain-containing protein [Polyangiaceae bacterium]
MNLYAATVPQFKRILQNVERWMDKAVAFAEGKKFDPNSLLSARLAPDQFALVRQIQSVADQCKLTVARLTAKDPPKHPDTEQSFEELRKRLHSVIAYLDTFSPADFDGAAERQISLPFFPEGKMMLGAEYLVERQLPNLYFHASMTYAILRHNGVDLGKGDFLGQSTFRDK